MVGAAGILSGGTVAQAMVNAANAAKRPNFELQFNIMQNTAIRRLNSDIAKLTADNGLVNDKVNVFLNETAKKLTSFQNNLGKFTFDNARNFNAAGELSVTLDAMNTALANNDTATFNSKLTKLNETIGMTHESNGIPIGIFIPDGIHSIRRDGLVNYNNGGTTTRATSLADFASTAAAQTAITNAKSKLSTITEVLSIKAVSAENMRVKTDKDLNSTIAQINAARAADRADKAIEIFKLKRKFSTFLKSLSLAFESSLAMSDKLSATLFNPPKLQPGSVINMFS